MCKFLIITKSIYDDRDYVIYLPESSKQYSAATGNFYYTSTPFYENCLTDKLKLARFYYKKAKNRKPQYDWYIKIIK